MGHSITALTGENALQTRHDDGVGVTTHNLHCNLLKPSNGDGLRVTKVPAHRVVAAILRRGDRVLLCHRHPDRAWYPNVWDVPGGHVEPDETLEAALSRELREELGAELRLPLEPPFEYLSDRATGIDMTLWLIDYDGALTNHATAEHDEIRWVDAEELASLDLADARYVDILTRAISSH